MFKAIRNTVVKANKYRKHLQGADLLKTIIINSRLRLYSLPIIIYPDVHVFIGRNAKIVHNCGTLRMGMRWSVGRFRQSELVICDGATLEINDDFKVLTGSSVIIERGGRLELNKGGLNVNSRLVVFNSVTIGKDSYLSENVTVRDSDNHSFCGSKNYSIPIKIGDNVLVGLNSTILKGVTIGNGSVVAANSLVNKDVPPRTLVGGIPAKVIKNEISWDL